MTLVYYHAGVKTKRVDCHHRTANSGPSHYHTISPYGFLSSFTLLPVPTNPIAHIIIQINTCPVRLSTGTRPTTTDIRPQWLTRCVALFAVSTFKVASMYCDVVALTSDRLNHKPYHCAVLYNVRTVTGRWQQRH